MKKVEIAALLLVAALLGFSAGYIISQRPVAGTAQISLMSVPEQVVPSSEVRGLIDVNNATAAELADIPGIGPVLAGRIIDYREENGRYNGPDDLLNVNGIGEKTLAKIEEYIVYGGANEDSGG